MIAGRAIEVRRQAAQTAPSIVIKATIRTLKSHWTEFYLQVLGTGRFPKGPRRRLSKGCGRTVFMTT